MTIETGFDSNYRKVLAAHRRSGHPDFAELVLHPMRVTLSF